MQQGLKFGFGRIMRALRAGCLVVLRRWMDGLSLGRVVRWAARCSVGRGPSGGVCTRGGGSWKMTEVVVWNVWQNALFSAFLADRTVYCVVLVSLRFGL